MSGGGEHIAPAGWMINSSSSFPLRLRPLPLYYTQNTIEYNIIFNTDTDLRIELRSSAHYMIKIILFYVRLARKRGSDHVN